jgi:segregation and condensation protein B
METTQKLESILLFKGQPVSFKELAKLLETDENTIKEAARKLAKEFEGRGMTVVMNDHECELVTSPAASDLLSNLQKQESETELSSATLETLSIVLYIGPITRSMIDYIRGVTAQLTVRTLLVRGLIEKDPHSKTPKYIASLDTIKYLGLNKTDDLPNYTDVKQSIAQFIKENPTDAA